MAFECHLKKGRRKFCSKKCYLQSKLVNGKPTYVAVHLWLLKVYGKATGCENVDCKKISIKYEWAKLKRKRYLKKRNNFQMLCKSCHTLYDWKKDTSNKLSIAHKGQVAWHKGRTGVYTKESLLKMRNAKLKKLC